MSTARPNKPLTLVLITYTAPLADVDALMPAHVAWIESAIADGRMIAAGRRSPRTGGVLLLNGDADDNRAFAESDPFVTGGVATIELVAWRASLSLPGFADLLP